MPKNNDLDLKYKKALNKYIKAKDDSNFGHRLYTQGEHLCYFHDYKTACDVLKGNKKALFASIQKEKESKKNLATVLKKIEEKRGK